MNVIIIINITSQDHLQYLKQKNHNRREYSSRIHIRTKMQEHHVSLTIKVGQI